MDHIIIRLNTDTPAFEDEGAEIARILRSLADNFETDNVQNGEALHDSEKTLVGYVVLECKEPLQREPEEEKPVFWHSHHIEMWNLIAEEQASNKFNALLQMKRDGKIAMFPECQCFACDVGHETDLDFSLPEDYEGGCLCPLSWGTEAQSKETPCLLEGSPYAEYAEILAEGKQSVKSARVRELAGQIANLPLHPEHIKHYIVK